MTPDPGEVVNMKWRSTGLCEEAHGKDGKYLTYDVNEQGVATLSVWPSYSYFERHMMGENKGTRMRQWIWD